MLAFLRIAFLCNIPWTQFEKQVICAPVREQFATARILIEFMNNPRSSNPSVINLIPERGRLCWRSIIETANINLRRRSSSTICSCSTWLFLTTTTRIHFFRLTFYRGNRLCKIEHIKFSSGNPHVTTTKLGAANFFLIASGFADLPS